MFEEFKKTYHEIATKKRAELDEALARGEVSDPITATLVAWGLSAAWASAATSAIVSVGVAAASYGLSRAFAPRPPKATRGQMSGSLYIASGRMPFDPDAEGC